MIDFDIAVSGLRAAAPDVSQTAINQLEELQHDFGDSILSAIECAAVIFGQLGHESLEFNKTEENLSYSAQRLTVVWPARFPTLASAEPFARNPEALANKVYRGRMGNVNEGDGWRFRGSGYIHLTGRENFEAASDGLGFDYVEKSWLARTSIHAWRIADWYLRTRKRSGRTLIELAAAGNEDDVTRGINGGTNGLEDRKRRTALARRAMTELTSPTDLQPVRKGDRESVAALQIRLRNLGFPPGPIDGLWGPVTEMAVRRFQETYMLDVDGKVGPTTLAALNDAV